MAANRDRNSRKAVYEKRKMRSYAKVLEEREKKEVEYVISTMGNASLLSIAKARAELKKSGAQIEQIHPLRFLEHIFKSEKLRVALENMSKRNWVWKEFFNGLKEGLEE